MSRAPSAPPARARWPAERGFVTSGGRRRHARADPAAAAAAAAGRQAGGRAGRPGRGSMEPRAGCRLPVRVEQVVNGALLVTVSCGQRRFAGILLDCTKK